MTDEILDAVIQILQQAPALAIVKNYHKFDGFLPGEKPTISVYAEYIDFEQYDNSQDEATAPIDILVYVKKMDPVAGKILATSLAESVRLALLVDETLGGVVNTFHVKKITPATNKADESTLLHYALVECVATFFVQRQQDDEADPMDELDLSESIMTDDLES